MVGGISAVSPYISSAYGYTGYGRNNMAKNTAVQGAGGAEGVQKADGASRPQPGQNVGSVYGTQTRIGNGAVLSVGRSASPGTPIEPIQPISKLEANASRGIGNTIPFLREGMDPAELAVRMRMKYSFGTEGVQKNTEEGECQTCKERKYQDGSDDAGVSYKTPTRISPEQAATAVRGHEMEHVVRERAAAAREDRRVISQSVTMHTAICPECGTAYVSGGTTRTTTASNPQPEQPEKERQTKDGGPVAA
ncbi:hypothetical protein IMSAGC018_00796 [Lachnospiraceae bacterium]|nr:hypothetical protein IMSAGC018_00796 [Lachnospiraceae bacterium]